MHKGRVFFFFITLCFAVAGCTPKTSIGQNPKASQTYIKAVYSLPLSLDPIQMNDTASLVVANLIYDGLLKFKPNLEIEGALAKSWSTSLDGKTITFHLKDNIYFHNGDEINADDVVESLKRAASKTSQVFKYYDAVVGAEEYHAGLNKEVVGLKSIDRKTVQINLKYPFPPFISILAGATAKVLPKNLLAKPDFFKSPIGSGMFAVEAINSETKELSLRRVSSYYGNKPEFEKMILKATTESEAKQLALLGKVHDIANFPLPASDPIFLSGKNISGPVAATWIIGLNSRVQPFKDIKLREAFIKSFDTDKFRKLFFSDAAQAFGYVPTGIYGHKRKAETQATIKFENNAKKRKITIAVPEELAQAEEIKSFIENEWNSKGWQVTVQLIAWDKLMKGYVEHTHQAFLVSMNMDYPDTEFLLRNFESTNPDNFSGVNNKQLDQALKLARKEQDRKKRQSLYSEALKIIESESVTVNLFHPRANYWTNNCVNGFQTNILADVYIDYSSIKLDESCTPAVIQRAGL